jgi:hypothetical protein
MLDLLASLWPYRFGKEEIAGAAIYHSSREFSAQEPALAKAEMETT